MAVDDKTRQLWKVFSPFPLTADESDLYVDLEAVRGRHHVVKKLCTYIKNSTDARTCHVLTGHKGCGKSTELMKLKQQLESDEFKFYVVYCDIYDTVDLNDIDFPDLLLEILRQLTDDLRKREEIDLKPGYLADLVDRIRTALTTELEIDSVEIGTDIAKITAKSKGSPEAREVVRKVLEPRTSSLIEAANDLISEATLELSKKDENYKGIVLLVDNLDKMVLRQDGNCDSAEYLFVNRAAQMTALNCHVVYSMPISLAYSHQAVNIRSLYGGQLPFVPAVKLTEPPPKYDPYENGIAAFREILEKRLKQAEISLAEAFKDDFWREMIMMSGGQPTELMMIMREAIRDELPIGPETLADIRRDGRREYARMLLKEDYAVLEEVTKSGEFEPGKDTEDRFRELLNSRAVLQYSNDDEWYGLNPPVRDLLEHREAGKKKREAKAE